MSGPFNQEFGNNLFLSDPSSQQQENFVAFDQDDEGFGEYDDYDDGEISDEEEGEQGAPVTSGGDQGAAPTKHTDVKQNSAKQGVAQPSPAAAGEKAPHPSSSPHAASGPSEKAHNQKMLDDLRARLMARPKPGTPVKDSGKSTPTTGPAPKPQQALTERPPDPETLPTLKPREMKVTTNGTSRDDMDDLLAQGKAAAKAAEKDRSINPGPINGTKPSGRDPDVSASRPGVDELEQHKKIQSLSSRLPQKETTEQSSTTKHALPARPPPQKPFTDTDRQPPRDVKTDPQASPQDKQKPEVRSEEHSNTTSRRESQDLNIRSTQKPRPPNPYLNQQPAFEQDQSRMAIDQKPATRDSDYYDDLDEWLEMTNFHDVEYRKTKLTRERKKKRLRAELEDLEQEDTVGVRVQSVQATDVILGRRSASVMPPPPIPRKYSNGNVTEPSTPYDTPPQSARSDYKRPRSAQSAREFDAPSEKYRRSARSPSPRGGRGAPLERRITGGSDEHSQAGYARRRGGDVDDDRRYPSRAPDAYYSDTAYDRSEHDGYQPRQLYRGRGGYRGKNSWHRGESGRGARRGQYEKSA